MRNLRHREVKYLVPGHLSVAGLGFESMKFISGLHALNPWGVLFMGKVPYYLASKVDEWPWMSSWFTGFPQNNSLCWPCFSVVLSRRTPVQMGTGSLMHSASYRVGISELLGGVGKTQILPLLLIMMPGQGLGTSVSDEWSSWLKNVIHDHIGETDTL